MKRSRMLLAALFLVAGVAGNAFAAWAADGIKDLDYEALESDAIVWANPYAGEKPRVLFLTFDNETVGAGIVARRLEMDYEVLSAACAWDWGDSPERRARWREVLAKDYDVLVLGSRTTMTGPKGRPKELSNLLLRKVTEGMGVVTLWFWHWPLPDDIIGAQQADAKGQDALPGMPIDMRLLETLVQPKDAESPPVARIDEQGRFIPAGYVREVMADRKQGAFISWRAQRGDTRMVRTHMDEAGYRARGNFVNCGTFTPDMYIYQEYWLSFLCNAILWTAHREPAAYVGTLSLQGETVEVADAEPVRVTVPVEGLAPFDGKLVFDVHDYHYRSVHAGELDVSIKDGAQTFELSIPVPDPGAYLVDAWLKRDGKTVDWASGHFAVDRPGAVTEIRVPRPVHDRGDPVEGVVVVEDAPRDAAVVVELVDSWQRTLVSRRLPVPPDGNVAFRLPVDAAVAGIAFDVRVALVVGDRVHARAERPVPIRKPAADFLFIYCIGEDNGSSHIQRLRRRALKPWRSDGGGYIAKAFTASVVARDNLEPNCHGVHAGFYLQNSFNFRDIVYDDATIDKYCRRVQGLVRDLSPYGLRFLNTGDDSGPSRVISDEHAPLFRAYLEQQYATVAGLNEAWGTAVASWDEVTQKLIGEEKAKRNYVPSADSLRFGEDLYYQHHRTLREAAQAVNPDVAVGHFASGWGAGMGQFLEVANYFGPYWRDHLCEIVGAFHGKQKGYYGVNGGYGGGKFEPWYPLLSGCNLLHTWTSHSQMSGNLRLLPKNLAFNENVRELKQGIDMQVVRAEQQIDPVAILYSRPSGWASEMESDIAEIGNSRQNFNAILHELGLQYRYVYGQHVRDGMLKREGIKLLVLPYCQAMSAGDAEEIRSFVEQGGTVLADVRPAVWDQQCRALDKGLLDDVFGIRREPADEYVVFGDLTTTADIPGLAKGTVLMSATGDSSVTPTTATAHGETGGAPAVLVNTFGKGRAVLVNSFVGRYKLLQADGESRNMTRLFRWLVQEAGLETDRVRAMSGGEEAIGVRRVLFRNGSMDLIGVAKRGLACESYPVSIEFQLPEQRHVYEVRGGRYLGHVDRFADSFESEHVKFYAAMPYKVKGLSLAFEDKAMKGRTLIGSARLDVEGAEPASHVVFVQVSGPDGELRACFEQKLVLAGGEGELRFPIAVDEKPGRYTVKVKDVPTGQVASATFDVK